MPGAIPRVDDQHVRALELRLLDPAVRRDRGEVDRLLHPDFEEFGASGRVWGKASVLESLSADISPPPVVSGLRSARLSGDAMLVTYRAQRPGASASLRASVWLRDAEGWRVRFHQGTPTPE